MNAVKVSIRRRALDRPWALVAALASVLGLIPAIGGLPSALKLALLGAFVLVGPGAALQDLGRLPRPTCWLIVPLFGVCATILVTAGMAFTAIWLPRPALLALALGTLLVSSVRLFRRFDPGAAWRPIPSIVTWSTPSTRGLLAQAACSGALVGSIALWVWALPTMATRNVDFRGLLFSASPTFLISLLVASVGFLTAIRFHRLILAAFAVLVWVLLARLPTALAVELPLYSWTYKHFGVIDYINVHGSLDRGVDIYHSWPGMFSLFSWVTAVTGIPTLELALWYTPWFDCALAGAIYVFARSWRLNPSKSLVAAFLASVVNWVGQDYFSPQSVALVLAIGVLTLFSHAGAARREAAITNAHPAAIWVALVLFGAITLTHQLTPYWLLIVMGGYSWLRLIKPRLAILAFLAVAGGFLLWNYPVVRSYGSLVSFDFFANAQRNVHGIAPSTGQLLTSWSSRITTLITWAASSCLLLARLRTKVQCRRWLALAFASLGSAVLLLGQGYGGEALFRVFLYSIPGSVVVIAPWFEALVTRRIRFGRFWFSGLCILSGFMIAASSQAFYGAWFANRVDPDSLLASVQIIQYADPRTRELALAPGAPGRMVARYTEFARIDRNFDDGVDSWPGWLGFDFRDTSKTDALTSDLLYAGNPAVVLITRQMKIYSDYYGLFPVGALSRFEQQLIHNRHWRVVIHTPTLTLVELQVDQS